MKKYHILRIFIQYISYIKFIIKCHNTLGIVAGISAILLGNTLAVGSYHDYDLESTHSRQYNVGYSKDYQHEVIQIIINLHIAEQNIKNLRYKVFTNCALFLDRFLISILPN